jgi:hypothetical protein
MYSQIAESIAVKERYMHVLTLVLVGAGLGFISFVYVSQPKTIAEVATKGSVAIGTYEIDQAEFARGVDLFRRDSFPAARAAFDRADPEKRDAAVQFYIAYSYYREGWGRLSNDDALFAAALTAAKRVDSLNPNFSAAEPSLVMKNTAELKAELEEGLKLTPSDFNPLKLARERK